LCKERANEEYLGYLPERAAQLFRFAHRLSAADDVRRHFRVLLLELCWIFQRRQPAIPNERPGHADERERIRDSAAAEQHQRGGALFAEEKRTGTIELLATSPIRDSEVIIGKWLSALILYGVLLLFSAINFAFLFRYGNPDWKPLAIGYLGLLLQAGGLLAIGTFISTLTRNQIIAGAATFGVCLLLWILEWVSGYETATWAKVLAYFSVITHFDSFSKGVLDTKDAVFYVSMIFLGLFLTSRSMESLRWRS
jgi:hypothetical protein